MSRIVDDAERSYFLWLVGKIVNPVHVGFPQPILLEAAFEMDFIPMVPNDENRDADGIALRDEWERFNKVDILWMNSPCSVLEMLIALASRMNDVMYDWKEPDHTGDWFWRLIDNLGLLPYKDLTEVTDEQDANIEDTLAAMVNREYQPDGHGGLFPIPGTIRDQRTVEIWYQMHEWLQAVAGEKL